MRFRAHYLTPALQQMHMLRSFPQMRATSDHGGWIAWVGPLQPSPLSVQYIVRIDYHADRDPLPPKITVLAPSLTPRADVEIPHLFGDSTLCLHEPGQWNGRMVIADTTVPWTVLWLYFYEIWQATGEWLGGGSHPAVTKTRGAAA